MGFETQSKQNPAIKAIKGLIDKVGKVAGKTQKTDKQIYAEIKQLEKRLKVADSYAQVGDWSKVEYHLMICYKQKENDVRVIEKLLNLYKEKREIKMINKFEKKLNLLKGANNKK